MTNAKTILELLDGCAESYTFPMLDNGYVYLAAARLSLFRSANDWALVTEVFGFSPRARLPDLNVQTFASRLHQRDAPDKYASRKAYENYLQQHAHDESRYFFPIEEGDWIDGEDDEAVSTSATGLVLRGGRVALPSRSDYARAGIELEHPERIAVFELCRALAASRREQVLATTEERRVSVPPELVQLLVLDDWLHPDLCRDERPSGSVTFQQLAQVLATGDVGLYRPQAPGNTYWKNWPEGGSL